MSAQTPPTPDPADPCPELSDAELLELATANTAKGMLSGLRMAGMDDTEIALFLLTPVSEEMITEVQTELAGCVVIAPVIIRTRVARMLAAEHAAAKDVAITTTTLANIDCGQAH